MHVSLIGTSDPPKHTCDMGVLFSKCFFLSSEKITNQFRWKSLLVDSCRKPSQQSLRVLVGYHHPRCRYDRHTWFLQPLSRKGPWRRHWRRWSSKQVGNWIAQWPIHPKSNYRIWMSTGVTSHLRRKHFWGNPLFMGCVCAVVNDDLLLEMFIKS